MYRRLVLTILTLALVASACSAGEPARDSTGAIIEVGNASVFALQVGDCFDDDPSFAETVTEVAAVPCTQPHDNEIYYEYSMTNAAYPGDDAALDAGAFRCLDEFDGFVGIDYLDSELDLFPITPTAESWAEGDRVVYCALYALDLRKLAGSMQGSRI